MSEFTRRLWDRRNQQEAFNGEASALLDALDARVRALEEKFVATELRPSPTETVVRSSDVERAVGLTKATIGAGDPAIVRDVHADAVRAAVLAERERCARVVLGRTCSGECADETHTYCAPHRRLADEIRRGA